MGKEPNYLLNRRLGGPQSQTGHFWRMFSCVWLLLAMLGSEETDLIIFVKMYRMYVHCCLAVKCAINTQQHYLQYCPYMNDDDSEPSGHFWVIKNQKGRFTVTGVWSLSYVCLIQLQILSFSVLFVCCEWNCHLRIYHNF
jgi:hypothetical protein